MADEAGTAWQIGCDRVVGSSDDASFFHGEVTYVPDASAAEGSLTVTLTEFADYWPEEQYTFNVAQQASFLLQDGKTTVDIPAGAFGSTGNGIMTVVSGTGYTIGEEDFPTTTFNITFTVDGEEKIEPAKPVTIRFTVDQSRLDKLGVSAQDLFAARFDDTSKSWKQDASYAYDSETGILSVSVKHFSIWGELVDKGKSLKRVIPTDLSASVGKKQKQKRKVTLTWAEPSSASDTQAYELDLLQLSKCKKRKGKGKKKKRKKKKKKKGKKKSRTAESSDYDWTEANTNGMDGPEHKTKLTCGEYVFRVRMEGEENSNPKEFTVKK